jgi:AbrB family looped-hinge helix DNA binding protein
MTLTIDKFGRILIPKPLRDRLGLEPGTALAVAVRQEHTPTGEAVIELRTEGGGGALATEDGIVVHRGQLSGGFETAAFIRASREARSRSLAGLG